LYVTHDYLEALALGDRIAVLREGVLVQVGTREDLWLRPADIFVAGAFGQPRINLIGGVLAEGEGGGWFVGADGAVKVPLGPLPRPAGTPVTLGLRPRDLVFGEQPGMAPIRGRVYVTEPLGRQREVTVEVGAERIALVTPHGDDPIGAPVTISAPPARLLLFDGASGVRLELPGALPSNGATGSPVAEAGGRRG
ncbi:MAG: ABC transporter ATP-binding protein, partial [Chloroflexia bacterium]|nr:ABC transporter ATP-binding protein [Chloroflexia bacterium]